MKKFIRTDLRLTAAVVALATACPTSLWAQDQANEEGLQAIVVTARRVTENLQDVPISVGTVDQQALQARGIYSLTELKSAVANVTISKTGVAGGNNVNIRGIAGAVIPNVAVDSSIGLYVDGIYLGRPNSSGGDIADLERVEVLRGPQGTLAGRNAAGGAINFITAAPTGNFGVIGEGIVGNFGRYRGRVTVNSPSFGGFSARLTYVHDENHGTIRNRAAGTTYNYGAGFGSFTAAERVDAQNSEAVMAKLRYEGDSGLLVDYKFDYTDQREVFPNSPTIGFPTTSVGSAAAGLYLTQPAGAIPLAWRRPDYVNLDMASPARIRTYGHTLTASFDISDAISIKSITGYRNLKTRQQGEVDGLALNIPLCIACSVVKVSQNQFSQELQLIGSASRLKYIAGAYYFREKGMANTAFSFFKPLIPVNGAIPITPDDYAAAGSKERARNISYAAYGHIDYSILDNLELALGGRYTVDDRTSYDERPIPNVVPRSEVKFKRFNYDVALTYSVTPDIHLYGRYATGYKSGGVIKSAVFRPEDVKSYEFGFKSELLNRKIRFNAAYFHTKIDDLQRVTVGGTGLVVQNLSTAKVDGVEAELLVVPVHGLTLGVNYGYNDPRTSTEDRTYTPRHTLSFNAQYDTRPFDNGSYLSFRVDGDYRSKYYGGGTLTAAERTADPAWPLPAPIWAAYGSQQAYMDAVIENNLGGGYLMANARISINELPIGGAKARIAAFVRNITDVEGRNYVVNNSLFQAGYERPMNYGLELSLAF